MVKYVSTKRLSSPQTVVMHPGGSGGRQLDVLNAMVRDGYITAAVADKAYAEDLGPKLTATHQAAKPAQ